MRIEKIIINEVERIGISNMYSGKTICVIADRHNGVTIRRDKEVGFKIWFNRPYLTDENRFDLKSRQLDYEKFPSPVSNIVCFNYNGDLSELIKGYFDKLLRKQVKNQ